ncbi:hypothetical protein RJ639_033710 [Escallonia herrerae]|uniref:Uncharacterized protein n=1 Tax=Escallonia herrerae TaxID=1293975 RepID=A0AA88X9Y8_9ASTE|nr:hypothetical protein RJ639_033710 [Escallonia herrerae]
MGVLDCNDQGVEYVVAKVIVQLHDLLGQGVEAEELNQVIPCEIGAADEVSDPLLAIQVNIFECGGLTIGGCCSHRIGDGSTIATFIYGRAIASQGKSTAGICPSFDAASFFPGRGVDKLALNLPRSMKDAEFKSTTKMFAFNKKAISTLRAMYHGPRVSSLQLVNAILWKALIGVDPDFGLGKPIWTSVVNMPLKNVVILMDDKRGEGIEAWVQLDAADMPMFEQDSDITTFATHSVQRHEL